ncbi:MAG: carbamoyltransferase HypF [Coriobacteriales bacterium]|nr:carbamoyltransferase HypF [Coriobacteriales bacterium]
MIAKRLHITGIVQGVGFRPFIYRLALAHSLVGWVLNSSDGVHLHLQGNTTQIDAFICDLPLQAPPAASIDDIIIKDAKPENCVGFSIRSSKSDNDSRTLVSPDIATCSDCLHELFDANDRRFHYPFINCTNCGPRFTIINGLPYDRPLTSMQDFTMCEPCATEYADPLNRRFHAQPDACFSCGPHISLSLPDNNILHATSRSKSDTIISRAAELLTSGAILAIKGLGGYHLATDATNEAAVARLRHLKRRPHKPFALMFPTIDSLREVCNVNNVEEDLLVGSIRPIVLLKRKPYRATDAITNTSTNINPNPNPNPNPTPNPNLNLNPSPNLNPNPNPNPNPSNIIANSVAGSLHELGVMLPFTPLHHLLLSAVDRPLVMTSANISGQPIVADVLEAHDILANIADAFLDHNRDITSRYDDSVVRVINGELNMLRRARGYAPVPLALPKSFATQDCVLAAGADQKSTFCFAYGGMAWVSQHLGDLQNAGAFANYTDSIALYRKLFNLQEDSWACDMHPNYFSSNWVKEQVAQAKPKINNEAKSSNITFVQHHHAHIAAVMAENDIATNEQVIGVAFDGTGYGSDGSIWGGEFLLASYKGFSRFAHLREIPLPGGAAAISHPARMAYSLLRVYDLLTHQSAANLLNFLGEKTCDILQKMLSSNINSPLTTSAGRLFDAISAILGICLNATYDGQPAIELEAAIYEYLYGDSSTLTSDCGTLQSENNALLSECDMAANNYKFIYDPQSKVIDAADLLKNLLDDLANELPVAKIAYRFHCAFASMILIVCDSIRMRTNINTVALSGGVFMNRYLATFVPTRLRQLGFKVLTHKLLPANDGCIAFGQAAIALAD